MKWTRCPFEPFIHTLKVLSMGFMTLDDLHFRVNKIYTLITFSKIRKVSLWIWTFRSEKSAMRNNSLPIRSKIRRIPKQCSWRRPEESSPEVSGDWTNHPRLIHIHGHPGCRGIWAGLPWPGWTKPQTPTLRFLSCWLSSPCWAPQNSRTRWDRWPAVKTITGLKSVKKN